MQVFCWLARLSSSLANIFLGESSKAVFVCLVPLFKIHAGGSDSLSDFHEEIRNVRIKDRAEFSAKAFLALKLIAVNV